MPENLNRLPDSTARFFEAADRREDFGVNSQPHPKAERVTFAPHGQRMSGRLVQKRESARSVGTGQVCRRQRGSDLLEPDVIERA